MRKFGAFLLEFDRVPRCHPLLEQDDIIPCGWGPFSLLSIFCVNCDGIPCGTRHEKSFFWFFTLIFRLIVLSDPHSRVEGGDL
jgi:hypothetical protein